MGVLDLGLGHKESLRTIFKSLALKDKSLALKVMSLALAFKDKSLALKVMSLALAFKDKSLALALKVKSLALALKLRSLALAFYLSPCSHHCHLWIFRVVQVIKSLQDPLEVAE